MLTVQFSLSSGIFTVMYSEDQLQRSEPNQVNNTKVRFVVVAASDGLYKREED